MMTDTPTYSDIAHYEIVTRDYVPEGCVILAHSEGWTVFYRGKIIEVDKHWLDKIMSPLVALTTKKDQ